MPLRRVIARAALPLAGLSAGLFAGRAAAESDIPMAGAVAEPSVWSRLIAWIQIQQRAFHSELVDAFQALVDSGGMTAAGLLIGASFLYGVFHAAGPGHGKVVLTTYLATHGERLRRGVSVAVAGSLSQGVVAIALIYGLLGIAEWVTLDSRSAAKVSEQVSYILLMLLGSGLAVKALVDALARVRAASATGDGMVPCGGCAAHAMPAAVASGTTPALSARIGVIASIGFRPCTGAIIVLVFAQAMGLYWAGIAAVAAMSVGTALAVAALAFVVVNARGLAARLAGGRAGRWRLAGDAVALAGGAALTALGFSLLMASLAPAHPLGL